jgi:predicted DCC family thiol-disulfide oxidoreductase YuxK
LLFNRLIAKTIAGSDNVIAMSAELETPPTSGPRIDPAPGHGVVLFDGECPFCRRTIRIVKKLDWFARLHYQSCRELDKLPPCAVPLDAERMIEEMHVVPPRRDRAYAGYSAVRWMFWRLPPVAWLAPFLYVPGVPWLGNKVYRWVAKNRFDLVPCDENGCRVPLRK